MALAQSFTVGTVLADYSGNRNKVEGRYVVKILRNSLNLLLNMATFKNKAGKKVKATVNVEVEEENGLLYGNEQNKSWDSC
jgi:hypothetical protein